MENTVDPDQMLTPEDNWSRSTVFSYSLVLFNNLENPDKLIWFMISINSIPPILAWKTLWILIRCLRKKTTDLDLQCFLTHLFWSIIKKTQINWFDIWFQWIAFEQYWNGKHCGSYSDAYTRRQLIKIFSVFLLICPVE